MEHRTMMSATEYATAYRRGYRHSNTAMSPDMDRNPYRPADPASDAWDDGYLDAATGRDMWHLRDCAAHGNGAGECGQA